MKNIFYLGPYKENSGLGRSSRRLIDCLNSSSNINLSIRPVYFSQNTVFDPSEDSHLVFTENEENFSPNYDCIIQHGHPEMFEYHQKFGKNIGLVEIETMDLSHTGWIEKINLLDEVVVGSLFAAQSLYDSGVSIDIKIIPEPFNIEKFHKQYDNFFFNAAGYENKPFVFYTIGQYSEKKNIKSIIVAFLLEFEKEENVKLFIKTGDYYIENMDLEKLITFDIKQIQKSIRKQPENCGTVDVLCGILKEIDIMRLHVSSDCYVNGVRGDSFGTCAVEAMLANNLVINTQNIGSNTYINNRNGIIAESSISNVYSSHYNTNSSFTIYEKWYDPHIDSLREGMRQAYEMNKEDKASKLNGFDKSIFENKFILEKLI
jgi:glycosyltransferase involved in cell wall biosynthesis